MAHLDANKWAVSSRGFNGRIADKMLVLIDGRSVYTPLFSGVFWEIQDLALFDIERIEVIRGPGATIWGARPRSRSADRPEPTASVPRMRIEPDVGRSTPAIIPMVVVFPAPFGPRSPKISPRESPKLSEWTAGRS